LWKNPKGKIMSTKLLYHKFGVAGVQYNKPDSGKPPWAIAAILSAFSFIVKNNNPTIRLFLPHCAGCASSLAVEEPAEGLRGILTLGAKRQLALSNKPVSSVFHTIFDEFVFITARPSCLYG
jgi:hypothetical protein